MFSPPALKRLLECEVAECSLAHAIPERDADMERHMHVDTYTPKRSLTCLHASIELLNAR